MFKTPEALQFQVQSEISIFKKNLQQYRRREILKIKLIEKKLKILKFFTENLELFSINSGHSKSKSHELQRHLYFPF